MRRSSRHSLNLRHHFPEIKTLFFPRWDRHNLWRISTRSRRKVHGHCDPERRVIAIVIQHEDPDEQDKLLIHEICHAVVDGSHGKKWQDRMERAAKKADELGRDVLAKMLRQEIAEYQEATTSLEVAYNQIRDALSDYPDLTFPQIKRWLADQYGLLVSEVCTSFRRAKAVFQEAKRDALDARALKAAWLKENGEETK